MKRVFLFSILTLLPGLAFGWDHGPLKCQGLYGIIGHFDKVELAKAKEDANAMTFIGSHDKHIFKVDWNYELDTLYTAISVSGVDKFFATMRVPTENHNDSFGEFRDENEFRLGVTCAFEK